MVRPLEGITVVEVATAVSGPYACWLLGQMGATVVKVESTDGDMLRQMAPRHGTKMSYEFYQLNWGKLITTVDLRVSDGQETFRKLVSKVDVLIENFRPGVMARWGLSYESLSKLNPRLIYGAITGFGSDSRYASNSAYDTIIQALSGIMASTGHKGNPPTRTSAAYVDSAAGSHMAAAVLGALRLRERTGRGTYVEVAMRDVAAAMPPSLYNFYYESGEQPLQLSGNRAMGQPLWDTFETSDGYVYLMTPRPKFVELLFEAIGKSEVLESKDLQNKSGQWHARHELHDIVESWTKTRTKAEVSEVLGKAEIPCGAVLTLGEVLADEDLKARGVFQEVEHHRLGRFMVFNSPLRFAGMEKEDLVPVPDLGEGIEADALIQTEPAQWKALK